MVMSPLRIVGLISSATTFGLALANYLVEREQSEEPSNQPEPAER